MRYQVRKIEIEQELRRLEETMGRGSPSYVLIKRPGGGYQVMDRGGLAVDTHWRSPGEMLRAITFAKNVVREVNDA